MSFTLADMKQYLEDYNSSDTSARSIRNYVKIANDSCAAFHNLCNWSFDRRQGQLVFNAAYQTGTVAINVGDTALTGTGTIFTTAMTGRYIRVNNDDVCYKVTYVSATALTLESAYLGTANVSGVPFCITQDVTALPTDFKSMQNPFITTVWWTLNPADIGDIEMFRIVQHAPNDPLCYAIAWQVDDANAGIPVPYIWVHPQPLNYRIVQFPYYKHVPKLTSDSDTFGVPAVAEPALREFAKAFLYQLQGDEGMYVNQLQVAERLAKKSCAAFRVQGELPQRKEWTPDLDRDGANLLNIPIYLPVIEG